MENFRTDIWDNGIQFAAPKLPYLRHMALLRDLWSHPPSVLRCSPAAVGDSISGDIQQSDDVEGNIIYLYFSLQLFILSIKMCIFKIDLPQEVDQIIQFPR